MLIAVSGKIGSGKDAFADKIIQHYKKYNIIFENKKFAYDLKFIVSYLTGLSMDDVMSREGKLKYLPEWGMTVGEMQQKIGTEAIRNNLHKDAWVLSLFSKYNPEVDNWVVSDVRFLNEANYIKKMGGLLIRLNGDPTSLRANDQRDMNHASEVELDNYDGFDLVFENKPPIENLDRIINDVVLNMNRLYIAL